MHPVLQTNKVLPLEFAMNIFSFPFIIVVHHISLRDSLSFLLGVLKNFGTGLQNTPTLLNVITRYLIHTFIVRTWLHNTSTWRRNNINLRRKKNVDTQNWFKFLLLVKILKAFINCKLLVMVHIFGDHNKCMVYNIYFLKHGFCFIKQES